MGGGDGKETHERPEISVGGNSVKSNFFEFGDISTLKEVIIDG